MTKGLAQNGICDDVSLRLIPKKQDPRHEALVFGLRTFVINPSRSGEPCHESLPLRTSPIR